MICFVYFVYDCYLLHKSLDFVFVFFFAHRNSRNVAQRFEYCVVFFHVTANSLVCLNINDAPLHWSRYKMLYLIRIMCWCSSTLFLPSLNGLVISWLVFSTLFFLPKCQITAILRMFKQKSAFFILQTYWTVCICVYLDRECVNVNANTEMWKAFSFVGNSLLQSILHLLYGSHVFGSRFCALFNLHHTYWNAQGIRYYK